MGGWAAKGGELDRETKGRIRHNWTGLRTGLGYVRQNAGESVIWTICHIIGTRCNDIQRKKRLAEIRRVFTQETETVLAKRGVHITLQSERRTRYSTAEVGNLKNKRSEEGTGGKKCLREGQNAIYLLLQCTTHNGGVSSY